MMPWLYSHGLIDTVLNTHVVQHQIESLERSVREKSVEVKQLQKQNAELERARHTEVVKLRLEVCICVWGPLICK